MNLPAIFGGLLTGGVGGLFSGFLGVTSGGVLVPLLVLLLGKDQHVAQSISLVAQIFPTSLSGVRTTARAAIAFPCAGWSGSRSVSASAAASARSSPPMSPTARCQYSRALMINTNALEYWITRLRG
jgi:uncharacterized membrane protein YfcA